MRTATSVPEGIFTTRGAGGSTGFISSRGGAGTSIGGATGAGKLRVPGPVPVVDEEAVWDGAGVGAGAGAGTGVCFAAVTGFGGAAAFRTSFTSALAFAASSTCL